MDYAPREFLVSFRRLLAGALCASLLVAFWAERPSAAASSASSTAATVRQLRGGEAAEETKATAPSTALIGWIRRPWLGFYTLMGAPALDQGPLDDEGSAQFRFAVGRLAVVFFAAGAVLWWRGRRHVTLSRLP